MSFPLSAFPCLPSTHPFFFWVLFSSGALWGKERWIKKGVKSTRWWLWVSLRVASHSLCLTRSPHPRVLKRYTFEFFVVLEGPLFSQTSNWCFGRTSLNPTQLLPATVCSTICLPAEILSPSRLSLDSILTRWLNLAACGHPTLRKLMHLVMKYLEYRLLHQHGTLAFLSLSRLFLFLFLSISAMHRVDDQQVCNCPKRNEWPISDFFFRHPKSLPVILTLSLVLARYAYLLGSTEEEEHSTTFLTDPRQSSLSYYLLHV